MEIKRCVRCGSLHTTENSVCNECGIKDKAELAKLQGVINEGFEIGTTKQDLAIRAGITAKNLNRYLQTEEFSGIYFPEASENIDILGTNENKLGIN